MNSFVHTMPATHGGHTANCCQQPRSSAMLASVSSRARAAVCVPRSAGVGGVRAAAPAAAPQRHCDHDHDQHQHHQAAEKPQQHRAHTAAAVLAAGAAPLVAFAQAAQAAVADGSAAAAAAAAITSVDPSTYVPSPLEPSWQVGVCMSCRCMQSHQTSLHRLPRTVCVCVCVVDC